MKKIFLSIIITVLTLSIYSQCVNCSGSGNTGYLSSIFGENCIAQNTASFAAGKESSAKANYATAFGFQSQAWGQRSVAIGYKAKALNISSIALGSYVTSSNDNAIVIGSGLPVGELNNNIFNSLMIGFNSTKPTFYVGPAPIVNSNDATGKIGIGTSAPLAKLHLRADEGEEAAVFIQPFSWIGGGAGSLALGNEFHGISAMKDRGLFFRTQSSYNFNEGYLKYGMDAREGSVLLCADSEGTAVWTQLELPAPSPWLTSGTNDIYFSAGKVGIGTINTYGYELAVLGKILADEVMIKHPVDWGDYVFKPDYNLMPLNELSLFIKKNQHLPNVPSEKEVMENGYGLAEMNGILLKKVEELTLYILEQQKVLETQQAELNVIKDQLKKK